MSLAVGVATLVCLGAGLLVLAQMIRMAAEQRRYESVLLLWSVQAKDRSPWFSCLSLLLWL